VPLRARTSIGRGTSRAGPTWRRAKVAVRALFGSLEDAREEIESLQDSVPVRSGDRIPMSLSEFESLSVPLRRRYDALSQKERDEIRARVGEMYDAWRRCWFGRLVYRKSCEACQKHEGHVMAYYLFKAATLVGKVVRDAPSGGEPSDGTGKDSQLCITK
jgi:hypothetical protein